MPSWSDPNPSNQTSAALSSQYKVDAAQIGGVVAAILASRNRQAELQQQENQFQQQQATRAYGDMQKQQQASQADDAANAAIYGQQYPNDPYGGFTDPNKVPDYGGAPAWQAEQKAIADHIAQQRVDAYMHRAYSGGGGSGGNSPIDVNDVVQEDDYGNKWRIGAGGRLYPYKEPRAPNDEPPADFPDAVTGADMYNLNLARRSPGVSQADIQQAMRKPDLPPDLTGVPSLPQQTVYTDETSPQDSTQLASSYGNRLSPQDQEAYRWAKAHMDDSRAAAILSRLGIP